MSQIPPVVVLHGWSLDAATRQKWQPVLDGLEADNFSVQFLSIPGLSAKLNAVWTLNDYARWLEQALKPFQSVILLGHSFGGQLAVRYTAAHPKQVHKLILIASAGVRDHSLKAKTKRGAFFVAAKIGKLVSQSDQLRNLLYKLARERDYLQAPPLLRQTMAKVVAEEVIEDMGKITCPTLLIWGEQDQVTPLWQGKIFQAKIPQAQLKIINGARHSPQYTHPEPTLTAITHFLKATHAD